jgi:membrane-associated phospholipid phosphatase
VNIRWTVALLMVCIVPTTLANTRKQQEARKQKHVLAAETKEQKVSLLPKSPYSAPVSVFASILKDVFEIHINLASFDFFRIGAAIFPIYAALRMADERIHSHFYDADHHKNKNQCTFFNHYVAQEAIAIPILALVSLSVLSGDEDLRATSRVFAIGMPFVLIAKDIIKQLRFKAAYRPYNEYFEKKSKHTCGGFPSGHMAEMSYMTVLYSMRHGIKFAVPLTALSVYVGATFVSCNRHYASQIAAGAGLGALYAVAASRVIDAKLEHNRLKRFEMGLGTLPSGDPALSFNYRY